MKKIQLLLIGLSTALLAEGGAPIESNRAAFLRVNSSPCAPAASRTTLDVNSIRVTVLNGGNHWPDIGMNSHGFEVPAGSEKSLHFAGSLWIGGRDQNGILSVAAQTYRQTTVLGIGFWSGPIPVNQSVQPDSARCQRWDRIWKLSKAQVQEHRQRYNQAGYVMPTDLAQWPGNGDVAQEEAQFMAPFADNNGNTIYEPQLGEYPLIPGDVSTWHVYNDIANGVNGGGTIGLGIEIQEENFGYNTGNGLDKAVFTRYKIINRRSRIIDSVHVGLFADPDIGGLSDDFIGCDVARNLGYSYNSDNDDDAPNGYGLNPPVFGMLLLEGPTSELNDGIDNDRDGIIDEAETDCNGFLLSERIAMTSFSYFNNDATLTGNPTNNEHVRSYLNGFWKEDIFRSFGGTGFPGTVGTTNVPYSFAFPGNSDPQGWGYVYAGGVAASPPFNWTEARTGANGGRSAPGDRRFVMSSGRFKLEPGEIQILTYAGLWARDSASTDSSAAMTQLLAQADIIRQQFANCALGLPDVRTVSIQEKEPNVIRLYPNPIIEKLVFVESTKNFDTKATVKLLDLQGKRHEVEVQNIADNKLKLYLNVAPGVYLLEVISSQKSHIQKILVH
jgi:hypothetical protein